VQGLATFRGSLEGAACGPGHHGPIWDAPSVRAPARAGSARWQLSPRPTSCATAPAQLGGQDSVDESTPPLTGGSVDLSGTVWAALSLGGRPCGAASPHEDATEPNPTGRVATRLVGFLRHISTDTCSVSVYLLLHPLFPALNCLAALAENLCDEHA